MVPKGLPWMDVNLETESKSESSEEDSLSFERRSSIETHGSGMAERMGGECID